MNTLKTASALAAINLLIGNWFGASLIMVAGISIWAVTAIVSRLD